MFALVTRWSLQRPRLVAALALLTLVAGAVAATHLPIRLLPQYATASVAIRTEAPGVSPGQIEQIVTRPLEIAVSATPGVASVSSTSVQGLSVVTLDLQRGADEGRVRQALSERLAGVRARLPAVAQAPQVEPALAAGPPLRRISLRSASLSPRELRDVADWTVRPSLMAVPGVAQVAVYGGEVRRMEVLGRPGDLADSDLGLLDLVAAAARATSIVGAGFIDTPLQRVVVESHGEATQADDIAAGQIMTAGSAPTRISDVADVKEASAPPLGDALVDGKPGVVIYVSAQPQAPVLRTSQDIDATLQHLQATLRAQGVEFDSDLGAPADQIRAGLRSGQMAVLVSAALIALLIWFGLRSWRGAVIALASAMVSIAATVLPMRALGIPLDAMALGGLAIGLAVILDDAVVDVDFIAARMARALASPDASRLEAILRASLSVRGPVFVATLLLIAVLAPLLAVPGVEGVIIRPLALSATLAAVVSMLVTATVTPALALLLLRPKTTAEDTAPAAAAASGWPLGWRGDFNPWIAASAVVLVAVVALALAASMRFEAVPSFRQSQMHLDVQAAPSLSPAAARELMGGIARRLGGLAGVRHTSVRFGRDASDASSDGLSVAHFDIDLDPALSNTAQDALEAKSRAVLADYGGLQSSASSRVYAGASMLGAPFRLELRGADYAELARLGAEAAAVLRTVPGARDVRVSSDETTPVVEAHVNFPRLAIYGLSAADVSETVETAFAGQRVGIIYDGLTPVDVVVTADRNALSDPEAVRRLLLRSTSRIATPLGNVADVQFADGPTRLDHRNGERIVTITAAPAPGDLDAFAGRAQRALASKAAAPPGVQETVFEGANPQGMGLGARAWVFGLASLMAMAVVLLVAFRNPRTGLMVLISALMAVSGAIVAARIFYGRIDLGVLMGLVAVLGLASRDAILLIGRLDHLWVVDEAPRTFETVLAAAHQRAPDALLSGVLALVAVVPLALTRNPASELLGAMALTVAGGVVLGGLLDVFVLPSLIFTAWRPLQQAERGDR